MNSCVFYDTSMLILYKNDRNVRSVLFTKISIKHMCGVINCGVIKNNQVLIVEFSVVSLTVHKQSTQQEYGCHSEKISHFAYKI